MEYGLGAIFGCPAHDQRDLDFALKYDLDVIQVVGQTIRMRAFDKLRGEAILESGKMINSGFLNGLESEEAKEVIINKLKQDNIGNRKTNYKLRDWGISRQRYWGCPIPMLYREDGSIVPVREQDLPVLLPILSKENPSPTKKRLTLEKNHMPNYRNASNKRDGHV